LLKYLSTNNKQENSQIINQVQFHQKRRNLERITRGLFFGIILVFVGKINPSLIATTCITAATLGQFHQISTRSFNVLKLHAQLFCAYILGLYFTGISLPVQKLRKER
jgi:hypothetical protein